MVMLYMWSLLRYLVVIVSCLEKVKHNGMCFSMRVREGFVVFEILYWWL